MLKSMTTWQQERKFNVNLMLSVVSWILWKKRKLLCETYVDIFLLLYKLYHKCLPHGKSCLLPGKLSDINPFPGAASLFLGPVYTEEGKLMSTSDKPSQVGWNNDRKACVSVNKSLINQANSANRPGKSFHVNALLDVNKRFQRGLRRCEIFLENGGHLEVALQC